MVEVLRNMTADVFSIEGLVAMGSIVLRIVLVLALARIVLGISNKVIDRVLLGESRSRFVGRDEQRDKTVASLLKSVALYVVFFVAGIMVLETVGINTSSLLAAAGIAGLAIGFGAQNLVKDVVSGFFILFEGQFRVGDYVGIGNISGYVEHTGLRTTWVRAFSGEVHIIPNGEVRQVTNFMGPEMRVLFNVPIAFEEDVDRAIAILEEAFERGKETGVLEKVVSGPTVLGVANIGELGVELMIWAKAETMSQWALGRQLRKLIKETMDQHGIKLGYPRRHIMMEHRGAPTFGGVGSGGAAAGSGESTGSADSAGH